MNPLHSGGMLLCPVRTCHLALLREGPKLQCSRGHSFDIARSGYINLLQPQDRRSKLPGDSKAAVAARRRVHDAGLTAPLLHAISELLQPSCKDVALDAGCGEGFYLGSLVAGSDCSAHGIDISIPAIDSAARRYGAAQWIVANADRFVPYGDRSFSIVMSITARMNPGEFRRVLKNDGRLLIGLAAPDDLVELRGEGHDRVARTVAEFAKEFTLIDRRKALTSVELDAIAVEDVLLSIYRPRTSNQAAPVRVTFSLDLLLFQPMK